MKPIAKDELYDQISGFLKNRGVELKEQGDLPDNLKKGCAVAADTINRGKEGIDKAKTFIDKKLDEVRQAIHTKTAPKSPPTQPPPSQKPPPKKAAPKAKVVTKAPPSKNKSKASPKRPAAKKK